MMGETADGTEEETTKYPNGCLGLARMRKGEQRLGTRDARPLAPGTA